MIRERTCESPRQLYNISHGFSEGSRLGHPFRQWTAQILIQKNVMIRINSISDKIRRQNGLPNRPPCTPVVRASPQDFQIPFLDHSIEIGLVEMVYFRGQLLWRVMQKGTKLDY